MIVAAKIFSINEKTIWLELRSSEAAYPKKKKKRKRKGNGVLKLKRYSDKCKGGREKEYTITRF